MNTRRGLWKQKQRRKMAKSTGLQCAPFNCYSYSCNFMDHARFPTKTSFFVFCKSSQKRMLGVIWSNEERIKMVLESTNPLECMRSIFSLNKITALLEVLWKDWFNQTNFTPLQKLYLDWKKSKRVSETISKEESKDSRLQWATGWCAAGLIWNWWQYSIWWLTSRFWKKNN